MPRVAAQKSLPFSKEKRYGWVVQNKPGALRLLSKHDLHIDHRYQRDARKNRVERIRKDFDWIAFGALTVAQRDDGEYYVIEGQHRLLAALELNSVTDVPCIVFEIDSRAQEARGFKTSNTERSSVKSTEMHRTNVELREHDSLIIDGLLKDTGVTVSQHARLPKQISCLTAMRKMVKADEKLLVKYWPFIVEAHGQAPINERISWALFYLLKYNGDKVTTGRIGKRLSVMNRTEMLAAVNMYSGGYVKGGAKVWARGLADQLNHGLQYTNRVKIPDDE